MNRFFRKLVISLLIFGGIIFLFNFLYVETCTGSNVLPIYYYKVIHAYYHDQDAFTQGLVFENGFLYEGTGLYRLSSLRRVELETGVVL